MRVATGDVVQLAEVQGGGSYLSQNDLRLHFGLGRTARVDRIEVRWPNGLVEEWRDIEANRLVRLTEGEGAPVRTGPASAASRGR